MPLSPAALAQLVDLRVRLIRSALLAALAMVVLYGFKERIFEFLAEPLLGMPGAPHGLMATRLPDIFFMYVKMATWGGLFLAFPYVLWEVWGFVSPGLYKRERRAVWPALVAVPLLFYAGGVFAFTVVTPAAITFFLSFQQTGLFIQPTLTDYFGFLLGMSFAFGLTFNLPVVLVVLMRLGVVRPEWLAKQRRLVIVLIFVAAAVLTPTPDPVTQLLLAVPLWALFEGSLWLGRRMMAQK